MQFQAYCFVCRQVVSVNTMLDREEFLAALDKDDAVEVIHTAPDGDHRWRLNNYEKDNLRAQKKAGTI